MAFRLCDRVKLVATGDLSTQLRTGDRGTVTGVRELVTTRPSPRQPGNPAG
jgi:hypothetical protein